MPVKRLRTPFRVWSCLANYCRLGKIWNSTAIEPLGCQRKLETKSWSIEIEIIYRKNFPDRGRPAFPMREWQETTAVAAKKNVFPIRHLESAWGDCSQDVPSSPAKFHQPVKTSCMGRRSNWRHDGTPQCFRRQPAQN